jgi:hypothetical protein
MPPLFKTAVFALTASAVLGLATWWLVKSSHPRIDSSKIAPNRPAPLLVDKLYTQNYDNCSDCKDQVLPTNIPEAAISKSSANKRQRSPSSTTKICRRHTNTTTNRLQNQSRSLKYNLEPHRSKRTIRIEDRKSKQIKIKETPQFKTEPAETIPTAEPKQICNQEVNREIPFRLLVSYPDPDKQKQAKLPETGCSEKQSGRLLFGK